MVGNTHGQEATDNMADQEVEEEYQALRKKAESMMPKYPEMTFKSFLEETPPDTYVYLTDTKGTKDGRYFVLPDIVLFCESGVCSGSRVFRCDENVFGQSSWRCEFLTYRCSNCKSRLTTFAIAFLPKTMPSVVTDGRATCLKLGQVPVFGPQTPARLISLIGLDREIFLQGRRAENRGMGIGAFAYYRRVVENQKNKIIAEIAKVAKLVGSTPETDALFAAAIKETRSRSRSTWSRLSSHKHC